LTLNVTMRMAPRINRQAWKRPDNKRP
jgi:hypothetical protein